MMGGGPGTGKSTIMRRFMGVFDDWIQEEPARLMKTSVRRQMCVMGFYEEGTKFPGTDGMSMAAMPAFQEWLMTLDRESSMTIIAEGDRLFSQSNLQFLQDEFGAENCKFMCLQTDPALLQERYDERGSNQDPTWLKGRFSKYNTIMADMFLGVERHAHDTPDQTTKIAEEMFKFILREQLAS